MNNKTEIKPLKIHECASNIRRRASFTRWHPSSLSPRSVQRQARSAVRGFENSLNPEFDIAKVIVALEAANAKQEKRLFKVLCRARSNMDEHAWGILSAFVKIPVPTSAKTVMSTELV